MKRTLTRKSHRKQKLFKNELEKVFCLKENFFLKKEVRKKNE